MENMFACVRCHICLSSFTENCAVSNLKCGHVYHKTCIDSCIDEDDMLIGSCPQCEAPIDTEPTRLYLNLDGQPYLDLYQAHSELIREQLLDTLQAEKSKNGWIRWELCSIRNFEIWINKNESNVECFAVRNLVINAKKIRICFSFRVHFVWNVVGLARFFSHIFSLLKSPRTVPIRFQSVFTMIRNGHTCIPITHLLECYILKLGAIKKSPSFKFNHKNTLTPASPPTEAPSSSGLWINPKLSRAFFVIRRNT